LQQVHDEAYAQGLAAGMEQGRQHASLEWQQRLDDYIAHQGQQAAEHLQAVHQYFAQALDALQQQLAQQVLQLACELARQVVRRELATDAQALLPVVREAVEQLLAEGRPARVRLHPADKEALGPALQAAFAQVSGVQWLADPSVPPGGCLVESGGTVIDGRLATRWERAVAALGLESAWQTAPPAEPPSAFQDTGRSTSPDEAEHGD
jgi:flagellar assembly protein FliH